MATKTMNFYAYGLQKDATVMLMFEPPNSHKLFKDQFPVVITFRAKGHAKASVQYAARLAFGYAQTVSATKSFPVPNLIFYRDQDNLVDSAAWVEVKSGDITSIAGGPGQKRFGENTKGNGTKLLVCKNNTDGRANLSIGFVKGNGIHQRYEPTLVWTGVGSKSNVTAQFTPNLTAYVTRDYKGKFIPPSHLVSPNIIHAATEMLRGEVETDAIWTCNLNELDDVTGWNFIEDDATGGFSIERSHMV